MKKINWLQILKLIYDITLLVNALYCLYGFISSEFISEKVYFGIFLIVFMILMLDNKNNNTPKNLASN